MRSYRSILGGCGLFVVSALLVSSGPVLAQTYEVLHTFTETKSPSDGGSPYSGPIAVGSTLYGVTSGGGANGAGIAYSINPNGSGFTVLHNFGVASDGFAPWGGLTAVGSTIYGTTLTGGTSGGGTVFSMNTDGSNYKTLYDFSNASSAPQDITTSVTVVGSKIYGVANSGGSTNDGAVYEMNTDGTGFTVLHNFTGTGSGIDFKSPLVASGTELFGISNWGGAHNNGFVYSINDDGTGFKDLCDYAASNDGAGSASPGLTIVGSTIYFNAQFSLAAMNTDGTNFHVIGGYPSNDGYVPEGFFAYGNTLYVPMALSGANNDGTILSYNLTNNSFDLLHTFAGTDGNEPQFGLQMINNNHYGTTNSGGADGFGVIFVVPEPASIALVVIAIPALALAAARQRARRRAA